MSMSISTAEAGLIAAPWDAARQNDPGLVAAAKAFYEQSKDLTQHGKKDHPTDRIVLDDVAATLALELGAQDPAHRAASLSEYVKLPGSGDGFTITVHADGHQTLDRTAHGPDGATSQPGAAAVIARYAAAVGHTPSPDEMAGFLAAAVAGGGLPAGADPAGVPLRVTGQDGHVLATGTAAQLLAQWSALLAANAEVTPLISLISAGADAGASAGAPEPPPPILNGVEGAAFLLGLAIQGGAATPALVAGYDNTVAYLDRIDQPMLAVAVHYQQAAAAEAKAGNQTRATLDETAAHLALQIAAEPEDHRGALSQTLHVGGKETRVTVSQTSTDITGGAQFHDIDQGVLGIVEQVVGMVADVLSFIPAVNFVAIPVAIAVGAAEGAQDLAEGDILGGVLALAGSAAGGVGQYASVFAGAVGATTQEISTVAQDVSRGVAAAQGIDGAVTAGEDGDGLAVLTSLAGGVAGSAGAGTAWGKDLAVGSALTGAGVAAGGGNWTSALAATETAAAGAGLFGDRDPDAGGPATAGSDGQAAQAAAQADVTGTAPVLPVQQQDLPAVADSAASTAPVAQASVASAMTQATSSNTGSAAPDAPNSPDGSSQQQADAQQAAQVQAAQRAGALEAAQTTAASQLLPVPPIPPAGGMRSPDADAMLAGMAAAGPGPTAAVQLAANLPAGTVTDVPAGLLGPAATAGGSGLSAARVNLGDLGAITGLTTPAPPAGDPAGSDPQPGPGGVPTITITATTAGAASNAAPPADPSGGSSTPSAEVPSRPPETLGAVTGLPRLDNIDSNGDPLPPASGSGSGGGASGGGSADGPSLLGRLYDALPTGQQMLGAAEFGTGAAITGVGVGLDGIGLLATPAAGIGIPVGAAGVATTGLGVGLMGVGAAATIATGGQTTPPPPIVTLPTADPPSASSDDPFAGLGAASPSAGSGATALSVNLGDIGPMASLASPSMLGQGTLPASGQTTPAVGLVLGATATMAPAELGSLSLGPALAPAADLLAAAAPAVAAPLALSGDTPADPNAMTGASVIGRNDLSAYAGHGQVNVYTTAPALGGLMSSVTGSTTLQIVPGASTAAPSGLVDTQGNTVGLLQNGKITLTAGGIPALDGNTMPPAVNLGDLTGALSTSSNAAAGTSTKFTQVNPMPSSPPPLIPPQVGEPLEGFTPTQPMPTSTAGEIPTVNLGPLIFVPPDLQIPNTLPGTTIGGQYLPDVWAMASTSSSGASSIPTSSGNTSGPIPYDIDTTAMSPEERAAVVEYAQRANAWLATNGPVVVQPTAGSLRSQASSAARSERLAAAQAGQPYQGQAGHVPDTALTGKAIPPAGWIDMPGTSNNVIGGGLSSRIGKAVDSITVDGKIP